MRSEYVFLGFPEISHGNHLKFDVKSNFHESKDQLRNQKESLNVV
jgi:hypothetical protein